MYRGEYVEYQIQIDYNWLSEPGLRCPQSMIPHGEVIKVAFPAEQSISINRLSFTPNILSIGCILIIRDATHLM
jgi:hypothetical protein